MQQSLRESAHTQSNTAGRILVIEDDEVLFYALTRILAAEGYNVVAAHDYRDALAILEDGGPIDLLLTDLRLPGVNGFALARMGRLRHHGLKIIYVTGYEDFPAHEALGPVMRKPIDQDMLLREIRSALGEA